MQYDYVIVGGGFSGSILGYLFQTHGYNVIILEKQSLKKKNKLCGGIITPKTYELLIKLFPQQDIDKLIGNHFSSVFVKVDNIMRRVNNINLRVVKRKELDDYVLNQYILNEGKIIEECLISNIDFENNCLFANDKKIKFKYLIGADGVFSQVRTLLTQEKQDYIMGYESFQNIQYQLGIPIVEFNSDQVGYNLIMPVQDTVLLGSCDITSHSKCKTDYEKMVKFYGGDPTLKRGGFLPTGKNILLNSNNVFFVGDAAGLIHPLTGEGMYYALKSVLALYTYFTTDNQNYELLLQTDLIQLNQENLNADIWKMGVSIDSNFYSRISLMPDQMLQQALQKLFN